MIKMFIQLQHFQRLQVVVWLWCVLLVGLQSSLRASDLNGDLEKVHVDKPDISEILIVISSDTKPYQSSATAIERSLSRQGVRVTVSRLDDLSQNEISIRTQPILAVGSRAASTLMNTLPSETILFYTMTKDPRALGLIERPNTSGVSTEPSFATKVQVINEAYPSTRSIGMLYRSSSTVSIRAKDEVQRSLATHSRLVAIDMDTVSKDSQSINRLLNEDVDVVLTIADPKVFNSALIKSLLLESIRKKIPVFGFSNALVRAGATLGVGIDPVEQAKQVGDMILKGEVDLHLEAKASISVNVLAAKRIQMEFSDSFKGRVDQVFGE